MRSKKDRATSWIKAGVDGREEAFRVNIGGGYNGSNALAAIAVCRQLGVPIETIREGLAHVKVAGRMETYTLDRNVDVIVDCAHNKMSYEALFDYVHHHYPQRKVGFVFGCVGGKAFNRRQEAGEIADANADFIIITERDPGKEDVQKICEEILAHVAHKDKAQIITDRDAAVRTALDKAEALGDCVLILAGCGSDAYVKRGTRLVEFSDRRRARTAVSGSTSLSGSICAVALRRSMQGTPQRNTCKSSNRPTRRRVSTCAALLTTFEYLFRTGKIQAII